jgi:hypothetical protein
MVPRLLKNVNLGRLDKGFLQSKIQGTKLKTEGVLMRG